MTNTPTFAQLQQSWKKTRQHLETACQLLPQDLREFPNVECGNLQQFNHFLKHNELGLALEELEGLGTHNGVPTNFWAEMSEAARNMEMEEVARRYEVLSQTSLE